jgi:exoribonuclease R
MNPLTDSPLGHLLRRKRKNREHLCHNLPEYILYFDRELHPNIDVETLQEKLNTLEEIHERVMVRDNILCRLS